MHFSKHSKKLVPMYKRKESNKSQNFKIDCSIDGAKGKMDLKISSQEKERVIGLQYGFRLCRLIEVETVSVASLRQSFTYGSEDRILCSRERRLKA